jgi:hypothetical protein
MLAGSWRPFRCAAVIFFSFFPETNRKLLAGPTRPRPHGSKPLFRPEVGTLVATWIQLLIPGPSILLYRAFFFLAQKRFWQHFHQC